MAIMRTTPVATAKGLPDVHVAEKVGQEVHQPARRRHHGRDRRVSISDVIEASRA